MTEEEEKQAMRAGALKERERIVMLMLETLNYRDSPPCSDFWDTVHFLIAKVKKEPGQGAT